MLFEFSGAATVRMCFANKFGVLVLSFSMSHCISISFNFLSKSDERMCSNAYWQGLWLYWVHYMSSPPEGQALHVIAATPSRVFRKVPVRSWWMICFCGFVSFRTRHTIHWYKKRSIMFQHQSHCHELNSDYPKVPSLSINLVTFVQNLEIKQASSYMPNWEKHLPFSGSQSDHFASLDRSHLHATSK